MASELVRAQREYSAVELYDRAVLALDRATTLVEAMGIHHAAEALKLQGKLAKDSEAIAKAVELRFRSERKLGAMLIELRAAGQLRSGKAGSARATLKDAGIDKRLSSQAQKLAAFGDGEFERVISDNLHKVRAGRAVVVNPLKDLSTEEKKLRRAIKAARLAEKERALPPGRYQIFIADPEWPDETWSEAGKDRSPENHYPTSSIADIAARPVGEASADDALCLLWIPMRHLARGDHVTVLRGWGFEPKAIIIWDKVVAGTGFWSRNRVEAVVIAVRGTMPAPAMGTQWDDLIAVPKTAHSAKPDFLHRWVEEFYPGTRRIELNARTARAGWARWGNEAPDDDNTADTNLTTADPAEPSAIRSSDPPRSESPTREDGRTDGSAEPILQDDPADATGDQARPLPSSRSHTAGGAGEEAGSSGRDAAAARGVGEGAGSVEKQAPGDLPHSSVATDMLTSAEKNDIIRAAYGLDDFPGIASIAERTGLNPDAVKQRARYMKLGDPRRQAAAAAAALTRLHESRRAA